MMESILFGIFLIMFSITSLKLIVIDCNEPLLVWWPISLFVIGCKIVWIAKGLI